MSSGDDDYGNPQRAIEHERTLNRMKDEKISRLTQELSAERERADHNEAERVHLMRQVVKLREALETLAANPHGANFKGVTEIARQALDQSPPPSTPTESKT